MAGGAEFLAGFVEGGGEDGEDYGAFGAADEIEAAFLLDELEFGRHARALGYASGPFETEPRKADPSLCSG